MKQIGILSQTLKADQKSLATAINLNKLCEKGYDCILFYSEHCLLPVKNEFALMQNIEALDFTGHLIATDDYSANILKNCIRAKSKYHYLWELDWYEKNYSLDVIEDLFLAEDINLLVRSEDHFNLVRRIFKPPQIVKEFSYEQITQLI